MSKEVKLECRHLRYSGGQTSIALDSEFWQAAEALASQSKKTWQEWAREQLLIKPEGYGTARWLRLAILGTVQKLAA